MTTTIHNAQLKVRIADDWKSAMKSGDREKKDALSLLLAAIKQKQVDERIELDDAGVVSIIEKMLKQRKDSISQFEAAKRQDLADREKFEVGVLNDYMPQAMDVDEIAAIVSAAMLESGAKAPSDMSRVIALIKPKLAGRADMGAVSKLVKAKLGLLGSP